MGQFQKFVQRGMSAQTIFMSAPMVCAILEDRKTQTRRVIKMPDVRGEWKPTTIGGNGIRFADGDLVPKRVAIWNTTTGNCIRSRFEIGDGLWVRETWCCELDPSISQLIEGKALYRADGHEVFKDDGDGGIAWCKDGSMASPWKPSIFMPRWASRINLKITNIRVERLQEIGEKDAEKEGVKVIDGHLWRSLGSKDPMRPYSHRQAFAGIWDTLNKKRGYGWNKNPWVWVIEFKRDLGD